MRPPTMFGAFLRRLTGRGDVMGQTPMHYDPLPQRLSAQDTNSYIQPLPAHIARHMTYWQGNQLPPSTITDGPMMRYVKVSSQDNRTPRLAGGSFNINLGQAASARLVARMHAAWTARANS